MKFKYRPSFMMSYVLQGKIYFFCQDCTSLPRKAYIRELSDYVGGDLGEAVYEAVTTPSTLQSLALRHSCDVSTLWRKVRQFYQEFDRSLL